MPNISTFEYSVQLAGREWRIRAMTAADAKMKIAKKVILQSGEPSGPDDAAQLARKAIASRVNKVRALRI